MPLDLQYLRYCQPGNPFYAPAVVDKTGLVFDVSTHAGTGWISKTTHPWINWIPSEWSFPRQGWKIHVSATPENAATALSATAQFCFRAGLAFKHLASARDLLNQNGKYADRSAAGKFITVYPGSDEEFASTLDELDGLLAGNEGPYILSDKRWRSGPVYFRYGAFVPPSDEAPFVSTLIDPEGNEVEDPRRPTYTPPDWATLPERVAAAIDDEDVDFPFTMRSALHFSNGGGVYLAEATTDEYVPTGTPVVLKEARPHAGLDVDGTDAVTRLSHEADVLQALEGFDCVPAYYGAFTAWEHRFLVMEHVHGQDLKREWMTRTPVLRPAPWDLHDDTYVAWLSSTVERLDEALAAVHDAGWLLGDIHPKNVIMRDGTSPCFIDFEFAHRMDPDWRCQQGAPGYEPFFGLTGTAADRWSMGMMELDLIYPQATIADQGNAWKIEQLLNTGTHSLSVPESVRTSIRNVTVDVLPASRRDEINDRVCGIEALSDARLREEITRGLLRLMDWGDEGPLAPGDIALFASDGAEHQAGYPYGGAGIIDQLRRSPAGVDHHAADAWLAARVGDIHSRGLRGREGLAYAARDAGLRQTLTALESTSGREPINPTLWSGWAGVGLYHLESGDDPLMAAHHLERLLDKGVQGETVGLLNGWCAAAIFFARLHEQTGEGRYVSLAMRAIEADLVRCTTTKNATLEFDEGWRTLPYLGVGSLGVGLAILELQRVTDSQVFSEPLAEIDAAATYHQCGQASLAHGLAGFLIYLNRRVRRRPSPVLDEVITSHLQSLRLHAVADDTGVFFRGNQNLRLSSDYLTGASGVLAALNEILDDTPSLPFGI
ncbi:MULTISPECIES: class III lanthionine synthetase LanKC [Actinomyces]|uniref:Class III lanthionine synthetase LanKC n=1 Tax=Actinomyces respiraculi TaxID=2744574 RepID=A0A7T0LJG3_9ACTO|nr:MULTISPECIES: class III lanthionine synthetase LanKC [Actinomyces]QPL04767.1 class III lanthionine synthetase LanKC [Actinomyces respiraculi]